MFLLWLFRLPASKELRCFWLTLCHLGDITAGQICSLHFDPADITVDGRGHQILRKNTVPSRFPWSETVQEVFYEWNHLFIASYWFFFSTAYQNTSQAHFYQF